MASGEPFEDEARVRRADGQYRWSLIRAVPLRDDSGNIVNWYAASVDIEDRKRAEEKVRLSEFYLAEGQRLATRVAGRSTLRDSSTGLPSYSGFMASIRAARPRR